MAFRVLHAGRDVAMRANGPCVLPANTADASSDTSGSSLQVVDPVGPADSPGTVFSFTDTHSRVAASDTSQAASDAANEMMRRLEAQSRARMPHAERASSSRTPEVFDPRDTEAIIRNGIMLLQSERAAQVRMQQVLQL